MSDRDKRKQAEALLNKGNEAYQKKDYKKAIDLYTQAIELDPKYVKAYIYRGILRGELGDHQGAIKDLAQAIHLDSKSVKAYIYRGNSRGELGDHLGAIEDYTQAIDLDPMYSTIYVYRGISKSKLEDYLGAIEDYTQEIGFEPDCALAYYNRGFAYSEINDEAKADEDFKEAQEIDPTIVIKEQIKKDKKVDKNIKSIREKADEAEDFQSVLSELESEFFENKEKTLLNISLWCVGITILFIILSIICEMLASSDAAFLNNGFWRMTTLIGFSITLTFYALGQYNKVANLRIDARNRRAMAKLLAKVEEDLRESKDNPEAKKSLNTAYAKLLDAIIYRLEFKKLKQNNQTIIEKVVEEVSKSTK
ncbi:MAG: tetratricopeptide repeat protein [Opitutae bacterium]|nr:tetratricopeptide repeat protein [Opitutae bacterium]